MINREAIFKYRIKLIKEAGALPVHELRLTLQEILLESKLPFEWTKSGPRLVLGPGEKQTNIQSLCQFLDIYLTRDTNERLIEQELSSLEKYGYKISQIEQIPYSLCSVEALAQYASYEVSPVKLKGAVPQELLATIDDKVVNLRPFIKQIKQFKADEIEIIIGLSILRSVGIEQILSKLPCLEVQNASLKFKRTALLWEDSQSAFRQI